MQVMMVNLCHEIAALCSQRRVSGSALANKARRQPLSDTGVVGQWRALTHFSTKPYAISAAKTSCSFLLSIPALVNRCCSLFKLLCQTFVSNAVVANER
jgi:hypothetical protein